MTRTESALQRTTQALKDIINSAHNGAPYSPEELQRIFTPVYESAYEALHADGVSEIA